MTYNPPPPREEWCCKGVSDHRMRSNGTYIYVSAAMRSGYHSMRDEQQVRTSFFPLAVLLRRSYVTACILHATGCARTSSGFTSTTYSLVRVVSGW